ncbi:MAG: hypothetical protein HQ515_23155 [Phycisphaeraceae bacterium]|nr:hypothetical protein [Phycisphaeraceae bacterium]
MEGRTLFFLMIVVVLGSTSVVAEQVTPSELLDRYAANLKVLEMHHIKSEEISEHTDSLDSGKHRFHRLEYESIQNGQLCELTRKKSVITLDNEGSVVSSKNLQVNTTIWDGQEWSEVSDFPTLPSLTPVAVFSKTDKDMVKYTSSYGYGGAFLDGIFWGDLEPLDSILKKSSRIAVLPDMDKANGFACYVIEAITPHGKYKLWIDPEHGYNIAKAETHKEHNDMYYGGVAHQQFGELLPSKGRRRSTGFRGKRPGSRESVHFYIDNVTFREGNGVWLPMEATYRSISVYDDRKATEKRHHKRTYINLKPDFDTIEAFIPEIPEGSDVFLKWRRDVRYTWQNGKLVKDENEDSVP